MERQAAVPRPSLRAALIEEGLSPVAWLRASGVVAVLAAAAMMPAEKSNAGEISSVSW
jgi:hypothetical protein